MAAVVCGGKLGATGLVATGKWKLGGKRRCIVKFATGLELEEVGTAWLMVIVVANWKLVVELPPESGNWVANGGALLSLPPD